MSTALEIESALKELPLAEAQKLALWLEQYLEREAAANEQRVAASGPSEVDYAARRRGIFGDKVLPNMVVLGREQERW